ncbi:glutathione S-transferase family protein [Marinobacterium maritimum]|uniref:glutathione transferase n=1 Tax=Marinobacterium maritimum TaxID=500162 RepID=A0ABP3TCJ0_9GAMM
MSDTVYIYGLGFSSFVRSVQLCCEEKGLAYQSGLAPNGIEIPFKSPEHLKLNPYGKMPVLLHNDLVLFETTTICRYLDQQFSGPALQPSDTRARALVDQCCAEIALYIDQALVRELLLEFAFPKGPDGSVRMDVVEEKLPAARVALTRVKELLGEKPFICGDSYTIADALLTPMLDYIAKLPMGQDLIRNGKLHAYLDRMRTRPSGQKILR